MWELGWVEDEKLIIDDKFYELMDILWWFVEEDLMKDIEG